MIRIAFFDTKAYDKASFEGYENKKDIQFTF